MPPTVAFCVFAAFIVWLLRDDFRRRPQVSSALWIPYLWMFILGSRFVSVWLGAGGAVVSSDGYTDGSPLDRIVFLGLIIAGFAVLVRRRVSLGLFIRQNRWVVLYFLYIGFSSAWSDTPFVSFKRWVKDVGNIIMVLVILTEADPIAAVKSLLARFAFVLIPMSILFNKYFPHLSRYYDQWTYQPFYAGVTTDKNLLGMTLYTSGIFLFWNVLDLRRLPNGKRDKKDLFIEIIMMAMTFWLLSKARSSTALACTVMGGLLIFILRIPIIRRSSQRLGIYAFFAAIVLAALNSAFSLDEQIVALLGRDMTFTGRTEIWQAVLHEGTNPIFGTGFYSFWSGPRVERLSADHYFLLNSAHNAYLETYLNTGIIGVIFLLLMFGFAAYRVSGSLPTGSTLTTFRLAVIVSVGIYGMTEAIYNRLGPIWMLLLLVIIEYKPPEQEPFEPRQYRYAR